MSLQSFHGIRPILFVACALSSLLWVGCLSGPDKRDGDGGGKAGHVSVALQLTTAALAKSSGAGATGFADLVDSVHVQVTASDMDTLRLGFAAVSQTVSILDVPVGASRRFEVWLFKDGKPLYSGVTTADLAGNGANTVAILCLPDFSRITASIHIPSDFPMVVAGGELRLWNDDTSLTATPVVSGELRNFRIEEVPGDRDYSVSVVLWDPAGDTIATAFRADLHIPKGQNVALVLPLTLTFSQMALAMTVADPFSTTLVLTLPGGRRVPSTFGDAVFSELYPIPATEDGGDATGEWFELFNRSADTLDLTGCQVIRDAGTSASMLATLPEGTTVAPGRGLIVGRSDVTFADVALTSSTLSLTNTSARLEFACADGAVRIDTLRYSTTHSDTLAARIVSAKITSLKPSRLATRSSSDAWCLSAMNPTGSEFAATPGRIIGGCGE